MKFYYSQTTEDLYNRKVITEADLRNLIVASESNPELMIMGNFIVERSGVVSLCRDLGINVIHSEDGFFPHYTTMHGDPLGFCWKSSLTQMPFRSCLNSQRDVAQGVRSAWMDFAPIELPPQVVEPYVVWPLQLIMDRVNRWDRNVTNWTSLIRHFRMSLPPEIQLVLKPHPRCRPEIDMIGIPELLRDHANIQLLPGGVDLKTLLLRSCGAGGVNSTVIYEARVMFQKPVYVYGRGWFTSYSDLFMPIEASFGPRTLNRVDWLGDNGLMRTERLDSYCDWFLAQLLARQITHDHAKEDPTGFKDRVKLLSYASFLKYGEDIFLPVGRT